MVLSVHRRKDKRSKINGLNLYLKKLKQQQIKLNVSSKKKIILFNVKSNETENYKRKQKLQRKSMNLKAGSLRKIDKIDKPLGRLMRRKERRHKLSISGIEEVTLVWILQILKR